VLGQRNAALKAGSVVELRSWTAALAESGRSIDEYRSGYVERLAAAAENIGRDLLGAAVRLEYRRGWPQDQTLEGALGAGEASDRSVGTTQVGPHRADLRVLLDARGVRDEASRGQQKLVATTLVLAQVRVQQSGEDERSSSVVLVDDPAAELDRERLERLLDALGALRAQLIVTGLSAETLPPRSGFPVFHVERGNVKPL
jgi:DNA replication and repair protein RecF